MCINKYYYLKKSMDLKVYLWKGYSILHKVIQVRQPVTPGGQVDPLHWKLNHCASSRHGALQFSEVSLSGFMVVVELERLSIHLWWFLNQPNKQASLWRLKQETNFWHQLFLNTTTLHHAGMAHCTAAQWGFIIRIYGRGRAGKIEQPTMRLVAISCCLTQGVVIAMPTTLTTKRL